MKKTILLAALLLSLPGTTPAASPGQVTVIVRMKGQADLSQLETLPLQSRRPGVVRALQATAEIRQSAIRAQLQQWQASGQVSRVTPLWIVNGLSVTAAPEVVRALATRPDVEEVAPDEALVVPSALAEPNVAAVGAPDLWSLGHDGQGAVIALLDSGVDVSHPDLAARYRGGTNGWFDPYGQHASPYDRTGHGTWTAGVMVGGDAGGSSIGVAPGARFIAARIWNDSGSATTTAIHLAFQWVLDPDGDPATDDAPDVVNNSWSYGTPGCNLTFQPDLQALRIAGILPVFAAGNFGPGSQTSTSPANYPEALSVGSVDDLGAIAADSSRGPSACGGATFPTVVAPGVDVRTTGPYSTYSSVSGTSVAAPHVSGLLALLIGAYPGVSGVQAEAAIVQTARDLGAAGPDDDFGSGIVDGLAAYEALASAPPPPPTAAADAFTVPGEVATVIADPGVLANDQDPGGLPLTAILATAPAHGALTLNAAGGFTYTPAAGFSGTDGFGYKATNGTQESAIATVTLTVLATAPTAVGDSYSLSENTTLTVASPGVLGNDTDPGGKPLSAVLVGAPQNGTAVLQANGGFTYTPRTNFYGTDGFTYQASNGTSTSAPATVSLTVTFVNQPPVARNDAATTTRGVAVNIPVLSNDSDVDGSLVTSTLTITTSPKNGSVSKKANGTVTYTPKRTFRGTDSFAYKVKDNNGATSNAATVTVQVK
jgi:subtilisin family serine protease